tara:strand:+ start:274 stop:423 length:150 start_codon:yes stop_codon:yes gene_type:complete
MYGKKQDYDYGYKEKPTEEEKKRKKPKITLKRIFEKIGITKKIKKKKLK